MNQVTKPNWADVRADFVPTEHFTSKEFLRLENERLWPKVWQVACREEEIPKVGSYVTYNVLEESITVVRAAPDRIKAFYNVCQHRGRRLTEGTGIMPRFHCSYHGWQYDLDGKVTRILDPDDWKGCPNFSDKDLSLKEVKVDTWGGFVFINMDPNAKPLRDFLDPVPHYLDGYELEMMRYRWWSSIRMPCNWKVALNAFNEAYHVYATHPQVLHIYGDDYNKNKVFGPHGMFYYPGNPRFPMGAPTPRLNRAPPEDLRPHIIEYYRAFNEQLKSIFCERDVDAITRIMTELPPTASFYEIMGKAWEVQREAAIAANVGWPSITPEQVMEAGTDWHIFPHIIILPSPTGALVYRSLPDPKDPDWCTFEVYSLQRYAPGSEPPLERKYLHGDDDWREFRKINPFLSQDFENVARIQAGMKSRGFAGSRTNPVQELTVSNFHRAVVDYVSDPQFA